MCIYVFVFCKLCLLIFCNKENDFSGEMFLSVCLSRIRKEMTYLIVDMGNSFLLLSMAPDVGPPSLWRLQLTFTTSFLMKRLHLGRRQG